MSGAGQRRFPWKRVLQAAVLLLAVRLALGLALNSMLRLSGPGGEILYGLEIGRGAFAANYYWDGTEEGMDFTIPDRVLGYRVKSLGGASLRAPCAFCLSLPESFGQGKEGFGEDLWDDELEQHPDAYVEELPFTLRIGKYLEDIHFDLFQSEYGLDAQGREALRHITLYVDCDPENRTFYSENGVLYERATGTPVLGTVRETP